MTPTHDFRRARSLALMGGAYGNVPALRACLADATAQRADARAFLGDALGCCGHSDETLALIADRFDVRVAGNHEQQAAAGAATCGCGYASVEDERTGCLAFGYALDSLSEPNRLALADWPDAALVETRAGRVLLCHGSPTETNEFLYESELDDARLAGWLDRFDAVAFACTHTGLPWVRRLTDGRLALNCGVVGKPDHDGDPAVHYALLHLRDGRLDAEIRRVVYDHTAWADRLDREGVAPMFVEPIRTGVWTTGLASLPTAERSRPSTAAV